MARGGRARWAAGAAGSEWRGDGDKGAAPSLCRRRQHDGFRSARPAGGAAPPQRLRTASRGEPGCRPRPAGWASGWRSVQILAGRRPLVSVPRSGHSPATVLFPLVTHAPARCGAGARHGPCGTRSCQRGPFTPGAEVSRSPGSGGGWGHQTTEPASPVLAMCRPWGPRGAGGGLGWHRRGVVQDRGNRLVTEASLLRTLCLCPGTPQAR